MARKPDGLRGQHVPFELQFNRWAQDPNFRRQKSHLLTLSADFYRGHYGIEDPAGILWASLAAWGRRGDEDLGALLEPAFLAEEPSAKPN